MARSGVRPLEGVHVLVVDDHEDTRDMIGSFLTHQGAQTVLAENAARARELLAQRRIDLIVTDIAMPEESGIQLMHSVRGAPLHSGVPAIAISGQVAESEIDLFRPELFHAVLAKPFELTRLVHIARELLDHEADPAPLH